MLEAAGVILVIVLLWGAVEVAFQVLLVWSEVRHDRDVGRWWDEANREEADDGE